MKRKILSFTYDDCVTQDRELVRMLDDNGLKATFNLNSGLFGAKNIIEWEGKRAPHVRFRAEEIAEIYAGHEIAAHTLIHPDLKPLSADQIVEQVETDRQNLEALTGRSVIGFAYPGGHPNYSDFVADVLRKQTGVKYARTGNNTFGFRLPEDFLLWHPTCQQLTPPMFRLAQEFLDSESEETQILLIWGHAYEFDLDGSWKEAASFFKKMGGRTDVEYMTSGEIFEAKMRGMI